jgi:HlyD family secretion protein
MSPDRHQLDALRIDHDRVRRNSPVGLWLAVGLFVAAGATGLFWWNQYEPVAMVRTAAAEATTVGTDRTLLNASGYVTARREATVSSKVTGRVVEVCVEEGKEVEEGQVLAQIDASNVEKSLGLAEAQLESSRRALDETRANLKQAEREWNRVSQLFANRAASQSDLDRAETEAASVQARLARQTADVAVAEQEVAIWQQQMDDTIIRAPFTGMVTSKDAQPGEMVSPISAGGGFIRTGICTLVDMSSLEIEVDVSESYINRVLPGQPVEATLDAYPTWRIPATVIAIIPTADRQKATVKVRVGFQQLDPRILPEMSVKVAFQSAAPDENESAATIRIPKSALRREDGQETVWIVREGRAERRAVTVGEIGEDQVAIAAGIAAGERVVVEGFESLTDGARVTERE